MGPAGAPLIVLVHGAMDRSAAMVLLSRRLDEDFRVLRYDRRGYARSHGAGDRSRSTPTSPTSWASSTGGRAVVFGHSYGGNVAMARRRHPELVRAVAVYEVPLSWLPWWPGSTGRRRPLATRGIRRMPPSVHASDDR